MIDSKRRGMRCRSKRMIRSHAAMIGNFDQGTIVHEVENLGRQLILVQWDGGQSTYVFPDEIEIMTGSGPTAICEKRMEQCI